MAFCTNCGKVLDPRAAFCTNCGARVEEHVTAGVVEGAHDDTSNLEAGKAVTVVSQDPPVLQRFPMQDGNDSTASQQGASNSAMNGGSFSSGIGGGSVSFPREVRPPAVNELLENWKYDPFLVAVGFIPMVIMVVFSFTLEFLPISTAYILGIIGSIFYFVHTAFSLAYVLVIHKSFFSEKPMIQDVKLVSFLNAFAASSAGYMGIIGYFGAAAIYERLNAELKNRKRGYGWIIMLVFCVANVISYISA